MSVAKIVEHYISKNPNIKDCMRKDLINFSSLSRKIVKDLGLRPRKDFDAILVACRRYQEKISKGYSERKVLKILRNSSVEIKNKIVAFIVEKKISSANIANVEKEAFRKSEIFYFIEGSSAFSIITVEDFYEKLKKIIKNSIVKEYKNLAVITIKSPKEITTTPGIAAYHNSLFAENGVNIIETMSCFTDTIFVIKEDDIVKVMNILKF